MARELLNHCERHALRLIRDRLPRWPFVAAMCRPESLQCLIANVDLEGSDR
jgi:hypothetical protein